MGNFQGPVACLVCAVVISAGGPGIGAAADDELSDEAIESFLLNGRVVRIHEMLPGSTEPMALELEMWGTVRKAAFKYRAADLSGPEMADSYRYEVAAYRLDRALGLDMVPVAVIRDIHSEGAVIEWVSGASTAEKLEERGEYPAGPDLPAQLAAMRIFDALIANPDRKVSDQLITPADAKLHLLDHSRAFQTTSELPEEFLSRPTRLPRALLDRLGELDSGSLNTLLGDLLLPEQIEALLERRDEIVAKVTSDRRQHGDATVFLD